MPTQHRTNVKPNKPFKGRHATKSALKEKAKGRLPGSGPTTSSSRSKSSHQQSAAESKVARRNTTKQLQAAKRASLVGQQRLYQGRNGVPRVVCVVELGEGLDGRRCVRELCAALGEEEVDVDQPVVKVDASRFKTSLQFLFPPKREFYAILDAAKAADYVLFLLSDETDVSPWGETLLRSLQAQGVPEVVSVVQSPHVLTEPVSFPSATLKSLHSFLSYFFPDLVKVYSTSTLNDASVTVRALCEGLPKSVSWREGRAWVVQEGPLEWNETAEGKGSLVVRGYVRGGKLSTDRLVHLPNVGDFQIEHIISAPLASAAPRGNAMSTDASAAVLSTLNPETADTLESFNEPDFMENEQTWPTEEDMASAPGNNAGEMGPPALPHAKKGTTPKSVRKVPKGTSAYQAAWIGSDDEEESDDDESDDGSEMEMDDRLAPADEIDGMDGLDGRDEGEEDGDEVEVESRAGTSVRFTDRDEADELARLAEYKRSRENDDREDLAFPDEMDTPMHIPASVRFQRFRGLRSFRTSPWDPYENLPVDYAKVFGFRNYEQTGRKVMKEALEEGVDVGTHVEVHIKDVPRDVFEQHNPAAPFFLFGLFEHEHKQSVLNFVVQRNTEYDEPVKAKDPLILCVGPRRYRINPTFSQHVRGGGKGANNVHKSERYLRPGAATVATVYGPIVFGKQPCLLLRESDDEQEPILVASGSFFNADTTRINAKRILLTGHPVKIHKKTVTVSLMFFNADDVRYFAPVQLTTKWGAVGHISEPLGTHGQFKAHFDKPLKGLDVVCMSLYKRTFPKFSTPHRVGALIEQEDEDAMEM